MIVFTIWIWKFCTCTYRTQIVSKPAVILALAVDLTKRRIVVINVRNVTDLVIKLHRKLPQEVIEAYSMLSDQPTLNSYKPNIQDDRGRK